MPLLWPLLLSASQTDKRDAASVTPGYDDIGADMASFTPLEGFEVYTGLPWSWL